MSTSKSQGRKVKLGQILSLEYGQPLPEPERLPGDVGVYGSNGLVGTHTSKLLDGPGIIVGRKGSIGKVAWSDKAYWPIDTTYYVKTEEDLKYVYYLLSHLGLHTYNRASGVPGLNRDDVYAIEVEMPDKEVQKWASEILSAVDYAIGATRRTIKCAESAKSALMQQLFTVVPDKLGKKKVALKEIVRFKSGGTPPKNRKDFWIGKTLWVSPKDMGKKTIMDTQDHISESAMKCTGSAEAGDILIVVRSGILAHSIPISLVDKTLTYNQDLKAIKIVDRTRVQPAYLFYFLLSRGQELLGRGVKRGTTVHSVSTDFLESLRIYLPDRNDQARIVKVLEAIDEDIAANEKLQEGWDNLKVGLMNNLLVGKIK